MAANSIKEMNIRSFYNSDISSHEKLMALLNEWHRINVPDEKKFAEKLAWCLEHCESKFRDIKSSDVGIDWYFESEKDATMFAMKWR